MSRNHQQLVAQSAGAPLATGEFSQLGHVGGRYPDFLIIGAGRCGTTTLADHLAQHPRIVMCEPKEPFFFSHDSIYARGEGWYRGLFARCRGEQICGEASTSYSVWPQCGDVAARVALALPQVKLIYIMRHPVERAYSAYDYDMVRLGLGLSFEEALERDDRFVTPSLFMEQIKQYLRFFDPSAFLFLLLDDLASKPEGTLARIWEFLGLDPLRVDINPRVVNSAVEHYVRVHTTQRLRCVPGVARLANALPRRWRDGAFRLFMGGAAYRWVARDHKPHSMHPQTRQCLLQRFQEPNRELAEFLNRDLSAWSR